MKKRQSNIQSFFMKGNKSNEKCDEDAVTNVDSKHVYPQVKQSEIGPRGSNMPVCSVSISPKTGKRKCGNDFQLPLPVKRRFNKEWLSHFEWLLYDDANSLAMCKICQQVSSSDVDRKWISGFSGPFKKESFAWHSQSKIHNENVSIVNAKMHPAETPMAKCVKKMDEQMFSHL